MVTEVGHTGLEVGHDGKVELVIPADAAMVSVLRTVTATLASRRDFTLDEIDDLRIAVDEACALLLPHSEPGGRLEAGFYGGPSTVVIEVKIRPTAESAGIDQSGFAWLVLSALADEATSAFDHDVLRVTLTKTRAARG